MRVRFNDLGDKIVPYDGVPFIILARYERDCAFGKDKHRGEKIKKKAQERELQVCMQA